MVATERRAGVGGVSVRTRLPGDHLHRVLAWCVDPQTFADIVEPAIGDLQFESQRTTGRCLAPVDRARARLLGRRARGGRRRSESDARLCANAHTRGIEHRRRDADDVREAGDHR